MEEKKSKNRKKISPPRKFPKPKKAPKVKTGTNMEPGNEGVVGEKLTEKQEKFCRNFTQNYELFRNATLSYAEAYGFDIDAQPDNDATYKLKDGTEIAEYALKTLSIKKRRNAEKVSESSQKTMYDLCSSYGSRLRKSDKIQARCRELLNEFFIDTVIDARMMEIIIGGDDKDSISAAKEYNALKQRVTKKVELGATEELKEWMERMNKILDE